MEGETKKRKSLELELNESFTLSNLLKFINRELLYDIHTIDLELEEKGIEYLFHLFYKISRDSVCLKTFRGWVLDNLSKKTHSMKVSSLLDDDQPDIKLPMFENMKTVESEVGSHCYYPLPFENNYSQVLLQQLVQQQQQQIVLLHQQSQRYLSLSQSANQMKSDLPHFSKPSIIITPSSGVVGGILSISILSREQYSSISNIVCEFVGANCITPSKPLRISSNNTSGLDNQFRIFHFAIPHLLPFSEAGGQVQIKLSFSSIKNGITDHDNISLSENFTYLPSSLSLPLPSIEISTSSSTSSTSLSESSESRIKKLKIDDDDRSFEEVEEEYIESDSSDDTPGSNSQVPTIKQLMIIREKSLEFQCKTPIWARSLTLNITQFPAGKIVWKNRRLDSPFKIKVNLENRSNNNNNELLDHSKLLIVAIVADHKGKLQLDAAENYSEGVSSAGISLFSNLKMTKGTWGKEWNITFVAIIRTSGGFSNSVVVGVSVPTQIVVKTRKNPQIRKNSNSRDSSESGDGSKNRNETYSTPPSNRNSARTEARHVAQNSTQGNFSVSMNEARRSSCPVYHSSTHSVRIPSSSGMNKHFSHSKYGGFDQMASLLLAAELKQQEVDNQEITNEHALTVDDDTDDSSASTTSSSGSNSPQPRSDSLNESPIHFSHDTPPNIHSLLGSSWSPIKSISLPSILRD